MDKDGGVLQSGHVWTTEEVRAAFWKTFHKQGEIFFDYLGGEEAADRCTDEFWREFVENLDGSSRHERKFLTSRPEHLSS